MHENIVSKVKVLSVVTMARDFMNVWHHLIIIYLYRANIGQKKTTHKCSQIISLNY